MTDHRGKREWWEWPAIFLIVALIGFGISTTVIRATPDPVTAPATTYFKREPLYPLTPLTPQVSPVPDALPDRVTLARSFKPLSLLTTGDRVLYDGNPNGERPVCVYRRWSTSSLERGTVLNAIIKCPGEGSFETYTAFLTSIEPKED